MANEEQISTFVFETGHRKLGGFVRMNGPLIRIDVQVEGKPVMTQWYGAQSLYCMTPTTEAVAKRLAQSQRYQVEPVSVYELRLPAPATIHGSNAGGGDPDDDRDG